MFGSETLEVLIGLITIYLVFGIACTAIVEAVAGLLGLRSGNLEKALKELFAGNLAQATSFVTAFYAHPLVQALSKGDNGRPSYIPSNIVGQVVDALVTANGTAASLSAAIDAMPGTPETNRIKGLLTTLVAQARGNVAVFHQLVEAQFDAAMDRASGWFKRHTQAIAIIAAGLLVGFANMDTVDLAKSLASNSAARVKMVEIAEQNVKNAQGAPAQAGAGQALATAESNLQSAGLSLGWSHWPSTEEWPAKLAGLVISLFAVSLGAPFWFDTLQRFMQVRAAGASPKEAAEEKKKS